MRVLMVADQDFLSREHAMLRRLEVGLLDEGVRVLRCVPAPCAGLMPSGLIPQAEFEPRAGRLMLAWRADRAMRELRQLDPDSSRTGADEAMVADIVHAWGSSSWDLAAEIASACGADLVLQTFSGACVHHAPAMERRWKSWFDDEVRAVWAAPDAPMSSAVGRAGARWAVRTLPWGVFVPEEHGASRQTHHAGGVCVCGSGDDPGGTIELLEGWSDMIKGAASTFTDPGPMLFLDEHLVDASARVWRTAEKLGLLDRLTTVARLESRRDPILRAQVMVFPEQSGVHRSIMLDAMAAGMVVLARPDDLVEDLADAQTVHLVHQPVRHGWRDALARALGDREWSARLGQSARQYIATHRLASAQVAATLELYRQLAGSPLEFKL